MFVLSGSRDGRDEWSLNLNKQLQSSIRLSFTSGQRCLMKYYTKSIELLQRSKQVVKENEGNAFSSFKVFLLLHQRNEKQHWGATSFSLEEEKQVRVWCSCYKYVRERKGGGGEWGGGLRDMAWESLCSNFICWHKHCWIILKLHHWNGNF